jgi:predicted transcriptional regulator
LSKKHVSLSAEIISTLREDPGQMVKELARRLRVNRTFLSGYLEALEDQGRVKSKKIGPAKVYFVNEGVER